MHHSNPRFIRRCVGRIKVVETTLSHFADIHARDHEAGTVESCIVSSEIQQALMQNKTAKTLFMDDEILAIWGAVHVRTGICEVWVLPSSKVYTHGVIFAKVLRRYFLDFLATCEYTRIQAATVDNPVNNKMLQWLGFEFEGLLRKYGAYGEDMTMWSIIKEGRS